MRPRSASVARRGDRLRLLQDGVGFLLAFGRERIVDVRAERVGLAPVAHGAVRVEPLRLSERAHGLRMVETVDEPQPLVEKGLRLRAGRRDRVAEGPEVGEQRCKGPGRGCIRRAAGGRHADERDQHKQWEGPGTAHVGLLCGDALTIPRAGPDGCSRTVGVSRAEALPHMLFGLVRSRRDPTLPGVSPPRGQSPLGSTVPAVPSS